MSALALDSTIEQLPRELRALVLRLADAVGSGATKNKGIDIDDAPVGGVL